MEINILILMALGSLTNPDQYNEAYVQSHGAAISKATCIYSNHQYVVEEGGVVIVDGVNP